MGETLSLIEKARGNAVGVVGDSPTEEGVDLLREQAANWAWAPFPWGTTVGANAASRTSRRRWACPR